MCARPSAGMRALRRHCQRSEANQKGEAARKAGLLPPSLCGATADTPSRSLSSGRAFARTRWLLAMTRALKRAQVVRHFAEFSEQLGIAKLASHGIAAAAECDRADIAGDPRQRFSAAQRRGRALTLLCGTRNQRTRIVLQEGHRHGIGDVGHGLLRQAAFSVGSECKGAQPEEIVACNSMSSASRNSLAMISALIVLRRLPSHIAMA